MGSAVVDRERLAPEEVSLLALLGKVGGCAPAGGLVTALGMDRKAGASLLAQLEARLLLRRRPMLGEELVQMISPAWELLNQPPRITTRLTYKRIRTGDLCLQYYAEFGRHLSSEVSAGLPKEQQYREIRAKMAQMTREVRRKTDARDRLADKYMRLSASSEVSEKERTQTDGRRMAAERDLKKLRQQRSEYTKANDQILASFRATSRLEHLGVYRDPEISECQTWVALDLGYLQQKLPEVLQRCDAVAALTSPQYQLLVWGVERGQRAAVEAQLKDLVQSLGLRRAPQAARVLPYARSVK